MTFPSPDKGKKSLNVVIIRLVHNWFKNHTQEVAINTSLSKWDSLSSGALPGSVYMASLLTYIMEERRRLHG